MEKNEKNNNLENKILTIPNILSFFRIGLIPVIVWLYLGKQNSIWTGYMLILSGVTDVVDGFIARKFHMISNLGKVLDPIADKLTQTALLVCLMIRFPLMLVPLILMVLKESFMAFTGWLIVRKTGRYLSADWHGKAATCLLYANMFIHVFWGSIPDVFSAIIILSSAGMIIVSFVLYAIRNFNILSETTRENL